MLGGSHAYGTATKDSDEDWRGVYAAPTRATWHLSEPQQTIHRETPDLACHELAKFCRLAVSCNPNVLETLFIEQPHFLRREGKWLRENRDLFLSRKAKLTYGGYAQSQLQKAQRGTGGSRGRNHFTREKFKFHLLRLMHQGIELLETGSLRVRLEEPEKLRELASRPLIEVEAIFADLDERLRAAAVASPLPEQPDTTAVNALLIHIRESML